MASSSSSSSIFVDSSSKVIITEEEFKNFHNIDRKLFLRLVTNNLIGQEPRRVTLFMALFLWFEKTTKNFTLISKLLQWPDTLLTDLTNEAAFIFTCIDDNDAIECFTKNNVNYSKYCDLPLTQKITNSGITLHFVHQNRVDIKQAIDKLINSVCDRAFDDIIVKFLLQKQAEKEHALHYNPMMLPPPHEVGPPQVLPLKVVVPAPAVDEGSSSSGGLGDASEVKVLTNGVCEIPRRVELRVGGAGERRHVAEDDRTVFLTFSKGYPISESEIIEFFYR
ncbi:uncharacterized protein LOC129311026 [Prosopis cineraria]|uniref:uncharacterized protein LOC129311026 n=1 Tax=Prosopis cineraria TaxID=364024 RepID=UPI00240F7D6E|nr:uncharacterized protein LOC129311026 [Prosopis cineraria]